MEPGLSFDNRVLSVRTHSFRMRIQWGDEPRAEQQVPGRGWEECFPDFCVLPKGEAEAEWNPFAIRLPELDDGFLELERFRDTIRPDVVDIAQPFCSHQWTLLKLLHNFPQTLDWACVNPVMAYCLANNSEFRGVNAGISAVQAVWYSHRKQKVILEWLGFPGTNAVVRLMRKIVPGHVSPSRLRRLRDMLQGDPSLLEMLCHQQQVTFGMLELVANGSTRQVLNPNLLKNLVEEQGNPESIGIADRLARAVGSMQLLAPGKRIPRFQTVEQVMDFCRDVAVEVQAELERARRRREERELQMQAARQRARRRVKKTFPPPPLPGIPTIEPIETYEGLQREGEQQDNCVGTYWPSVVSGNLYIYRVHAPQRATLAIRRGRGKRWHLSELEISNNRKPRRATLDTVKLWLQRSQDDESRHLKLQARADAQ